MLGVHFQFHSLQLFLSFVNCLVYFILFPYAVSSGFGQAILSQRLFCPGCPGLSYSLSCCIFLCLFSQIGSVMQNSKFVCMDSQQYLLITSDQLDLKSNQVSSIRLNTTFLIQYLYLTHSLYNKDGIYRQSPVKTPDIKTQKQ